MVIQIGIRGRQLHFNQATLAALGLLIPLSLRRAALPHRIGRRWTASAWSALSGSGPVSRSLIFRYEVLRH